MLPPVGAIVSIFFTVVFLWVLQEYRFLNLYLQILKFLESEFEFEEDI